MQNKFKFTTSALKALPANPPDPKGTELEFSDTEVIGLRCLSGKSGSKRFLLRYQFQGRKCSIGIGRFPDVDLATARKIARQHKALDREEQTICINVAHAQLRTPSIKFIHKPYFRQIILSRNLINRQAQNPPLTLNSTSLVV